MIEKDLVGLKNKVAELIIVRASGHATDSQREYPQWELTNLELRRCMEEGVGGVILFGGTTIELEHRTNLIQQWSNKPLLFCADVEEGIGQRFSGGTTLLPPMSVGQIYKNNPDDAIELAENYGRCIGRQAKICGLNWVLAPVCDINNNINNPVINVRAWGEDSLSVSVLAKAFQRGISSQKVLTCAKHFPGHGNTSVDSHLQLPIIDSELSLLKEFELIPFKDLIDEGVDSVMTGHLLLTNIDAYNPATLSFSLTTELLRNQLGFKGLVVTDALSMKAITKNYGIEKASIMAFAAGADLILMPSDVEKAIDAICQALISEKIPIQRLQESLERRTNALAKIGAKEFTDKKQQLIRSQLDLSVIEEKEDRRLVNELVKQSLVIRNPGPVEKVEEGVNLIRIDSIMPNSLLGNKSPSLFLPENFGYKTTIVHYFGISPWRNNSDEPLDLDRFQKGPIFLQIFMRGNPFKGTRDNQEPWVKAIQQLQKAQLLAGLVVYGNPYLWQKIIEVLHSSIPSAYTPGQIYEAQTKAISTLFGNNNSLISIKDNFFQAFTD